MTTNADDRPAPFGTGERLPDDDAVYRRLSDTGPSMVYIDPVTGEQRPTSGAFKPDADGVSVYSKTAMAAVGVELSDLFVRAGNVVVELPVAAVRASEQPLDAVADPWPADIPEPDHPRNAAHALVVGFDGLTKGQRKRAQDHLVRISAFG